MVVCRYFQQGYCRFGNGCRNEHIFNNKYSYNASQYNSSAAPPAGDQLLNIVLPEITSSLKSGQWVLSCYAPFKEKSNLPGFIDFSMEEIRFYTYQAQAAGTLQEYVNRVKNAQDVYIRNCRSLLNPSNGLLRLLQNLFDGQPVQSPFDTSVSEDYLTSVTSATNTNTTSTFDEAFRSHNANGFGNRLGMFDEPALDWRVGGSHQPTNQRSTFQNSSASALFGMANNNLTSNPSGVFCTQYFTAAEAPPRSAFSTSATPTNNSVFSPPAPPPVYQNPFEKPPTNLNNNPFLSNSLFGGQQPNNPVDLEGIVYSKVEALSEEDVTAYESEQFTPGRIPEVAPPLHLCQ